MHDSKTKDGARGRRRFLKTAGISAVGAAAAGAGALAAAPGAVAARKADPPGAGRGRGRGGGPDDFYVIIDDAFPETLERIESVSVEDLVIDEREVTGEEPGLRVFEPGDAHFGSITIRARVGKNSTELYQWWLDCSQGKNIRKSISVIALKRDGSEARRVNLFGCVPVRYAPGEFGEDGGPLERLTLRPEFVELVPGAQARPPARPAFEVSIASEDGRSEADALWESALGGAVVLDLPDDDVLGCTAARETTPGHKYVDTLTLRGPLTAGRKAMCDWINATVRGDPWKRTVVVKEIHKDGSDGKTFTYLDCFPTRYVFPALSASGTGNLYEEITVKPIRLELA